MIWERCGREAAIGPIGGRLLRLVESQTQAATLKIVDSYAEQALLEELLEGTKPAGPPLPPGGLHYLLATPFRYPPLPHGSRFGRRHEPGIFYGSPAVATVLAESAYYRLLFWDGMATPPPGGRLLSRHTLFAVAYASERGMRLHASPFEPCRPQLTDPADYAATQALGSRLREEGVEAFEFPSARDPQGGINVALFTPAALADGEVADVREWQCETRGEEVAFAGITDRARYAFRREMLTVAGRLPAPAS